MREKRRERGQEDVKVTFIDVKKAYPNAKCDEEDWLELPDEFKKSGKYAKCSTWQSSVNDILLNVVHVDDFTIAATDSELGKM